VLQRLRGWFVQRRKFLSSSLAGLASFPRRIGAEVAVFGDTSPPPKIIPVGKPEAQTKVPPALRRGSFLPPQSVAAVNISDDGQYIAAATMAFRDDYNFHLVSSGGKLLSSRYLLPWAPFQAAILPGGTSYGAGLAYSRVTEPYPTICLLDNDAGKENSLKDVGGQLGWLRYGRGDWRTGWTTSIIGDLVARNRQYVFTVPTGEGAWRLSADGSHKPYPLSAMRPFRLCASMDGERLACSYIAVDPALVDDKTGALIKFSSVVLALRSPEESDAAWSVAPAWGLSAPDRLPDPAIDFPELATAFHMRPDVILPFRVASSVAVNHDASRVAIVEFGGRLWIRNSPAIGIWDPPYHVVPFLSPQRGLLRIFDSSGRETTRVLLPREGLFDLRMDRRGNTIWCVPAKWFARGTAGCVWLPTDEPADTAYSYDLDTQSWRAGCQFPDAVNDLAVHPDGKSMIVSCWDGNVYCLDTPGRDRAKLHVGGPAVVQWSSGGGFAVAGSAGVIARMDSNGNAGWTLPLPTQATEAASSELEPVFEGAPIFSVGRVGPDYAYSGDIWLIKVVQQGILVDAGGISSIPFTWAKIRAAGLEPNQVKYLMHSHSHGDHVGAGYLWRAMGLKVVAPESASFALSWVMPMLTDYGVWVPRPVDMPLNLKRPGDETEFTLCGLHIRALFAPGHTADSVVYMMEFSGKRVAFTGDIGFEKGNDILDRCWGDREKARSVIEVLESKLIPWQPDYVFRGHQAIRTGTKFLQELVADSKESLSK
jgi:glyoxylase-like metal-dependent hydrolase (beta-lactamase superfamily II)